MPPSTELGIGEAARRSGLPVSTLHFYESKGLIQASRSQGNQRRYPRSVLRRLAVIKVAQKIGIPLAEIAATWPPFLRAAPRTSAIGKSSPPAGNKTWTRAYTPLPNCVTS